MNGELEPNHAILRECSSMCHRLPILNTPSFKDHFYNVCKTINFLCVFLLAFEFCL